MVTISDGYWGKQFNRSPSVIGKTFLLNLTPVTIVGVNPPGFTGAKSVQTSPDIFAPLALAPRLVSGVRNGALLTSPSRWWLQIMARSKGGTNEAAAQAQLNAVLQNAVVALMKPRKGDAVARLVVADGSRGLNEAGKQFERPLAVLLALVGLVLALACANLANLLLARSTARQREMSVRVALGAGRSRIMRQVLTESLLIAILGGALGLLLGYLGRNALLTFTTDPASETEPMQAAFSWGVFAFTAGLSLLTGLLFGLAPAWRATRTQVQTGLKDSARTTTRRREGYGGKLIVGFQVAISMLLVTGAGIFLRTMVNVNRIQPGFAWRNLILFQIDPPRSQYPGGDAEMYSRIEERLSALPGVESASGASVALLSDDSSMDNFVPTGTTLQDGAALSEFDNAVGTDYFTTMGIPILAGRSFTAADTARSPRVAIANEALSRKYFGAQGAMGRTFTTTDARGNKLLYTIAGVCGNTRYSNLRRNSPPLFFVSYHQLPDVSWPMTFAVRTRMPRAAMTAALRTAVQSVDRDLPLIDVRTQEEQIDQITMSERLFADLTGGFGVLALVLAAIGIYGVLAYSVSRRTSEIGIRMALGARPAAVLAMVLREATWIAAIGAISGTVAALSMGKLVGSLLYGLKPWDPATLLGSAMLLGLVALGASWIPAHRAATVDPMCALRHE